MKNGYKDTVKEFGFEKASKLMFYALKEIIPNKKNYGGIIISSICATFFAVIISFSDNTVILMLNISTGLLNVQLVMFSCLFAVYSILLAFLDVRLMERLAKVNMGSNSSLKEYAKYYESTLFLYFINIGITGIVVMLTTCMDVAFRLTNNLVLDTTLAIIVIFCYLIFSFRVFYEMKSTIYNTIILFRANIAYKFLDKCKDMDSEDVEGKKDNESK